MNILTDQFMGELIDIFDRHQLFKRNKWFETDLATRQQIRDTIAKALDNGLLSYHKNIFDLLAMTGKSAHRRHHSNLDCEFEHCKDPLCDSICRSLKEELESTQAALFIAHQMEDVKT